MSSIQKPIRVMLVDDHVLVLEGIKARLNQESSVQVVGEARDGQQALEKVTELSPDIVLLDVSMPILSGMDTLQALQQLNPSIKVIILTMHDNREYMVHLFEKGASGYLLKDVASVELIKAIQTVYQGGQYLCTTAEATLDRKPEIEVLTPRERTVLIQVAQGLSNKAIAKLLDISVRTVETHRQNIKQKLKVTSTAELTRFAVNNKMI